MPVCTPIHRWRRDAHLQTFTVKADKPVSGGTRLHLKLQQQCSSLHADRRRAHEMAMYSACNPMMANNADRSMPAIGGMMRRIGRRMGSHRLFSSAAAGL